MSGLLDIIVEMTKGKWWLSFDVAAPIQMTTKISLAATIMSAPVKRNVTVRAPYTSPRAARKITLSRRPAMASNPRMATTGQRGSSPVGAGWENNATRSIASKAAYSTTSTGVRALPRVRGMRGQGGRRMVLGRNQYRIEPRGGKNLLLSGPKPQPRPMTSNSMV
ncbi:Uncharacterised protein [Mycobacteroides abscessus subsp. massiliense]|nr:Uncharacterised protein [Mycobacteroides abscessus subsp. massiliense]